MRNATCTTIAPTGTLSIIAGCSSGVEPVFAYVFIRNVMDNTEMIEVNPILRETLEKRGLYSDELMRKIAAQGTLQPTSTRSPRTSRTSLSAPMTSSPTYHVKMQAAFQRHTDNAVSKTVNFTHDATIEDVPGGLYAGLPARAARASPSTGTAAGTARSSTSAR